MTLVLMLLIVVGVAAVSDAIRRKRAGGNLLGAVDVPLPMVGVVAACLALVFVVAFVGAL